MKFSEKSESLKIFYVPQIHDINLEMINFSF